MTVSVGKKRWRALHDEEPWDYSYGRREPSVFRQCVATTKKGHRCRNGAMAGERTCGPHYDARNRT